MVRALSSSADDPPAARGAPAALTWRGELSWLPALIAVGAAVADVGDTLLDGPGLAGNPWALLLVLGVVACDAALALPPRFAGAVAAAHAVLLVLGPLVMPPPGQWVNESGTLLAAFLAGAWLRTVPAFGALGMLAVGMTASRLLDFRHEDEGWAVACSVLASCLLPWLVGRFTMVRRTVIAELKQRAERRRWDERAAVQRAVAEERRTIARDLHDVISHHVSAIGMHAGALRLGLTGQHDAADRSLSAVETATRSAMADLRRLLDLLHGQETGSGQPGLGNIDELLAGVRAAGVPVLLTTRGVVRELPGSLDVAVYRVVQEALTNALRFGAGSAVRVELDYQEESITASVTNELPAEPAGQAAGHVSRGLAGIRQRVALFGGEATIGTPPHDAGWVVRASFPVEPPPSALEER